MILAPHALAGAAIAVMFRRHPLVAVVAAFLSHFVLDAIPHWAYKLNSIKEDSSQLFGATFTPRKGVSKDVFKTGIDFSAGLAIALGVSGMFFPKYFWLTFFGAAAGVLPDFLQVVYYLFPDSPLFYLQWFHKKIHARKHLDSGFFLGFSYQIIFSLAVILIMISIGPLF